MNVMERMKAAGYDPSLAREVHGAGTMECEEVEVTVDIVVPRRWDEKMLLVHGEACVPYTDGLLKPYAGRDCLKSFVSMYFEMDKVDFEYRLLPDFIRV